MLLNKLHLQLKSDHEENSKNKKECTEEEMQELFESKKKQACNYIEEFKSIRFPTGLTDRNDFINSGNNNDILTQHASTEASASFILTNEEVTIVLNKFYKDVDFVLETALTRHRTQIADKTPLSKKLLQALVVVICHYA